MEWVKTYIDPRKKVLAVDTFADGKLVYGCGDGTMYIMNFKTNKGILNGIQWVAHQGYVGCLLVMYPNNLEAKYRIASGSYDGNIRLWSIEGRLQKTLDYLSDDFLVSSIAYTGEVLVSGHLYRKKGSKTFKVNVWNIDNDISKSFDFYGVLYTHSIAYSMGYVYIGLSGKTEKNKRNKKIAVWNITNENLSLKGYLPGHKDNVTCVYTFYPDKIVSGSKDKTVKVWKRTGNLWACEQTLTGHSSTVNCVHAIADRVTSTSVDGVVKFWNLSTGDVQTFKVDREKVYSVKYIYLRLNTQHIITGSREGLKIWFYKYPYIPTVKLGYKTFPSGSRLFTLITSETFDRTRDLAFFGKHLGLNVRATLHNTSESGYVWLHVFNTTGPLRMLTAPNHWRQAIYGPSYISLAEVERRLTKYCKKNGYDGWHMRVKMDNRVSNVKEAEFETVVLKSSFDKLQFRGKKRITLEELKDKDHVRVSKNGKITFVKRIERLEEMFENLRF
jgi:WD40 repeat protein